ncbi:RNA polymerase sigma-70 factor, ECF subfamily [Amphibacillus marinus]|uniref:RNA polymerase sigma-70 factor, ECF subfamily n=1 Tax=Amphibacillus marinus TaxID=872970 RepID=A0A1H8M818_9BACI|nr:sigma-70 family RNA polymerase sigma factor [Amphibacillus marinus]SEO13542.1 RNA polymerase sigma-70 factor, ECF subfamily [Amphibacillus marinus]
MHFNESWQQHQSSLRKACLLFTQNYHDAEDLMQATWLKAYQRLGDKEFTVSTAYFTTIAKHLWIDQRRRKNLPCTNIDQEALLQIPSRAVSDTSELTCLLNLLVTHLTTKQLIMFLLADVTYCSLAEIAQLTQTSLGAVKASLFRARQNVDRYVRGQLDKDVELADEESILRVQLYVQALQSGDHQLLSQLLNEQLSVATLYAISQQSLGQSATIYMCA